MQWMCGPARRVSFVTFLFVLAHAWSGARGDLIRPVPGRSFPDIAGDIVGAQTYIYDPVTGTGIFHLVNAPHLISLGPLVKDMVQMLPDQDGTLTQSLKMKLDRNGRLVQSPEQYFRDSRHGGHRRQDLPGVACSRERRPRSEPSLKKFPR